jgi:hypothetical protein
VTSWRTVALICVPLGIAVPVILVTRGNLSGFRKLGLGWPSLLWFAAGVHLLRFLNPAWLPGWMLDRGGSLLIVVCWVAGTTWVLLNCRPGRPAITVAMLTTFLGFTINTAVILVNVGTMPFSVRAARWAGLSEEAIQRQVVGHSRLGDVHHLRSFSDLIPVPGLEKVVSIGDLLMVAGITGILVWGARDGDNT